MIIHFCEKCGNRVPLNQIESGAATIIEDVRAVCAGCSGKRPSRRASQLQVGPAASDSSARKSGLHIVPAAKKSGLHPAAPAVTGSETHKVAATHLPHASSSSQNQSSNTLLFVGGGIALVLVIVAVVLMSSGNDERRAAPKPATSSSTATLPATTPASIPSTTLRPTDSVPAPAATNPATPEPAKSDDGYDPRATVAASLLAQAKAQANTDPWASREMLEKLRDTYARTPAADEAAKLLTDWKPPAQLTPPGQSKPRLDGSADTFLMLSDAISWRCGHTGRAQEGRSIDGNPLRIGQRTFEKGIGFHSEGDLNYDLGGHYKWLSGYLGIDAETSGGGSVGFEIWLDGRKAWESGVLRGNDEARFFKLSVDGCRRLRFAITSGNDDQNSDHADLCRLCVQVGPDEPRDDYANTGAKPVETASTTPVPAPPPEAKPPEPIVPAVDDEALARQAHAQYLSGFWGALRQKGWTLARSRLDEARNDRRLATRAAEFKTDGELLALIEKAWTSIPEGATKLKDGRAFTLIQNDSKRVALGAGSKTRVLKATATAIEIEQDEGQGKLVMGIPLARLSYESNRELACLGLPEDGDGRLALALMDWFRPDTRNAEQADRDAAKALSEAEANKAPTALVARTRAWLDVSAKERAAETALKELEGLIEQKKGKEALAAFDALKKNHAGTALWAGLQPDLPKLDERLKPFRIANGLWVSYWSGDEINRFQTMHFAQAEANLLRDYGDGACDPRVPQDNFGIRMGGMLRIEAAGRYAIKSHSDDVMKVWLDGALITETNCNDKTADLDLQPGLHTFKVEFIEYHGGAAIHIWWKPPDANDLQPIPGELLQYAPDLKDEYQKP